MTKQEIRQHMLILRSNQNNEEKQLRDQQIINQIKKHPKFIEAKTVAIFYPTKEEINLLKLISNDKVYLFPKVEKHGLDFHVYDKQTKFEKSKFGILEPLGDNIYHLEIDLMIVPALAISYLKDRVGYGKGYYDQYIMSHHIKYTLGVIYDFQEVKEIETSPLDQKLDEYIKGSL